MFTHHLVHRSRGALFAAAVAATLLAVMMLPAPVQAAVLLAA